MGVIGTAIKISTFNVQLHYISDDLQKRSIDIKQSSENMLKAIQGTKTNMIQITSVISEYAPSTEDISNQAVSLLEIAENNNVLISAVKSSNGEVLRHSKEMETDMQSLVEVMLEMKKMWRALARLLGKPIFWL